MNSYDLLALAEESLPAGGRPRQAALRRALSTVYYALFHCLALSNADTLVGGRGAARSAEAWRQAYRGVNHAQARNRCREAHAKDFPAEIKDFAEAFVHLQNLRHVADYDPDKRFSKAETVVKILEARSAVDKFNAVAARHRRAFAVYALLPVRN